MIEVKLSDNITCKSQQAAIKILLENSECSISEIAKKVGASPAAVSHCNRRYRIRDIREYTKGCIKVGAIKYKNQKEAIRVLLKNTRKSNSEIAQMVGACPAAVSHCNKEYSIRDVRQYNRKNLTV